MHSYFVHIIIAITIIVIVIVIMTITILKPYSRFIRRSTQGSVEHNALNHNIASNKDTTAYISRRHHRHAYIIFEQPSRSVANIALGRSTTSKLQSIFVP